MFKAFAQLFSTDFAEMRPVLFHIGLQCSRISFSKTCHARKNLRLRAVCRKIDLIDEVDLTMMPNMLIYRIIEILEILTIAGIIYFIKGVL